MKFPTKIPNRKTKCKSAKTSNSSNLNESLDILRLDPSMNLPDTKMPQYQRAAAGKSTVLPIHWSVTSSRINQEELRGS